MARNSVEMGSNQLLSVDYKVYGTVQGVFFRKYTKITADKHGLAGWVRNESDGTVVGVIQGTVDKIKLMKMWLEKEGSPHSKIEKCEFKEERNVQKLEYKDFKVKKH